MTTINHKKYIGTGIAKQCPSNSHYSANEMKRKMVVKMILIRVFQSPITEPPSRPRCFLWWSNLWLWYLLCNQRVIIVYLVHINNKISIGEDKRFLFSTVPLPQFNSLSSFNIHSTTSNLPSVRRLLLIIFPQGSDCYFPFSVSPLISCTWIFFRKFCEIFLMFDWIWE